MNTYPPAWISGEIQAEIRVKADHTCEHCGIKFDEGTNFATTARRKNGAPVIGTVHHLNGDKSDCRWENLLYCCQMCHLHIQAVWEPGGYIPISWGEVPQWILQRGLPYQCSTQLRLFD